MSQVLITSQNVCHRSAGLCADVAHCVLLDFCSELDVHLFYSLYIEICKCVIMGHLNVSLSLSTTVDGDKLILKGAKLNSSEMLSAFQSMCAAKELQAKLAAAKK